MKKALVCMFLLLAFGCSSMQISDSQEAAFRILAVSIARTAMAFSPEASEIMTRTCSVVAAMSDPANAKNALQMLWTDLNDVQAFAVVQLINDIVTLAGGPDISDIKFLNILQSICGVCVVGG